MGCKIIADDYGMSVRVNRAIAELVGKNIVSKVGVMANDSVQYLNSDLGQAETGLHINLISYQIGRGISPYNKISLLKLLYLVYTKQLRDMHIIDTIQHQLEFLEDKGIRISYLDTHCHIHIIPRILKLLIMFAKTKGIASIRCITIEKKHFFFYLYSLIRFGFLSQLPKIILLYFFGSFMKIKLDQSKISYCRNLILMPLAVNGNYSELLNTLFDRFKNLDAEFVTHPGLGSSTTKNDNECDDYVGDRFIEYSSLLNLT